MALTLAILIACLLAGYLGYRIGRIAQERACAPADLRERYQTALYMLGLKDTERKGVYAVDSESPTPKFDQSANNGMGGYV